LTDQLCVATSADHRKAVPRRITRYQGAMVPGPPPGGPCRNRLPGHHP